MAIKKHISCSKRYERVRFSVETLREFVRIYHDKLGPNFAHEANTTASVTINGAEWTYPDFEEFLSSYSEGDEMRYFRTSYLDGYSDLHLSISFSGTSTLVAVDAPQRGQVAAAINFLDSKIDLSRLPEPLVPTPKPLVAFIGHGRNSQWRDLKDHLRDKHGIDVEAHEIGARAGHTIRDVLESMLNRSSIAFLVMTAEDKTAEGDLRARQNVVHEIGLFQGKLGFSRAVVLLEADVEEFSNIAGIQQLRFGAGNIREVFGDVLATIRREFPHALR
jgi:hypothetical protein